jgi:multimeric flavodoxin WrbA
MAKRIVAFFGSPRNNGNSTKLVKQVLAGAESAGATVVTYNLNDDGIKGCQGCYYCRMNEGCSTQDKLQPMYQAIKEADGVVVGFPVYFMNISGQSKQWIDRLFPMIGNDADGNFSPRYPGKKVVAAYAQGNGDKEMFSEVIESTNMFFAMFGWEVISSLLSYGSNDDLQYVIPQELMDEAFAAGKTLTE